MEVNMKRIAAERAVEWIEDGMTVGLGTGSTAYWAILRIAERVKEGLNIRAAASSIRSEELAKEHGIPFVSLDEIDRIDLTIDGADEVDPDLNLTKGGGGALLREKVLAAASDKFVVIVDESKVVSSLGAFPLPVEIVPFGSRLTLNALAALGGQPTVREKDGQRFVSDNGNWIADCRFGRIANPAQLSAELNRIPGVVDNGLFTGMTTAVVVGKLDGSTSVLRP
ncbi:ribose-5-phosphate isomerase RpiA [Cohnella lubricantis]|uniref:Ribose-5-phosphate isomerase A n=1 Tax=Cohnella lubricantis TaxID=2163172 RepID=A0A841TDX4_9BACL|nr:ribose-5-phosphate isomerase RpiA [Cohnella lubricantis]MBB6679484.1 ribose-5-phosphate isomerase RpiA [Cohnella lubricantis]MBP2118750.1 ribose 5-phosphate isomerase A [Cohnella lubricantis]